MKILLAILLLCASVVQAAAPVASCTASRTSGTAPLGVFWDCKGSTDSDTTNPFVDLNYTHVISGGSLGTWTYGARAGQSKNYATGPVAAWVFETAGTYVISTQVCDSTACDRSQTTTITVTDADTTYSGTATVCFYNSTVGTGCPSGATQTQSSDFDAAISSCLDTTKRCLFKRGDTFDVSTPAILNKDGPWLVGAYGSGAKPIVNQVQSSASSIIGLAANNSNSFNDGVVMGLDVRGISGSTAAQVAVDSFGRFDQITFLRVDFTDVGGGISMPSSKVNLSGIWDQVFIHEVTCNTIHSVTSGNGNCLYIEATRLSIQGGFYDNANGGEHNVRSMYTDRGVISNNSFTRPNTNKSSLTLRAPEWTGGSGPISANTYSQYVVAADNKFYNVPGTGLVFGTYIDSAFEGRLRYYIFERNLGYSLPNQCLSSMSSLTAIRNNLCDMSAAGAGPAIEIGNSGTAQDISGNKFHNNTIYSSGSDAITAIRAYNTSSTLTVQNNLVYAPSSSGVTVVNLAASTSPTASYNTGDVGTPTTNPFATTPTTTDFTTWQPSSGGYAKNGGTAAFPATYSDFFNCFDKTQNQYRIGAVVRRADALCTGAP